MKKIIWIITLISVLSLIGTGCIGKSSMQRKSSISARADMFADAEAKYPVPLTVNFPARAALVKYTERQDVEGHLYYVYVLSDVGNIIGYYVSSTPPVSTNAFLSSTEEYWGGEVMTAPSLDGIYYGGSGASSGSGWFIFDAATDALIIIYGSNLFVADQPLNLEAKPILVE